jgi:hypothetical protein
MDDEQNLAWTYLNIYYLKKKKKQRVYVYI